MSSKTNNWTGLLLSLFAGAAFGAQFPVAQLILRSMPALDFVGLRYLLAAVVFAGILGWREGAGAFRLEGKGGWVWLFGTLAFTGYNGLVFIGQHLAGPSGPILSSVMMGFMPLVTALVLLLWKGTRLPGATAWCILIGLGGILLVATKGHFLLLFNGGNTVWAMGLMLAAVICWVIFTIGATMFAGWSPLRYTTLTCIGGTISNAFVIGTGIRAGWFAAPTWTSITGHIWPLLYMSLVAGVAAVLAWNTACKRISPVDAALFTNNIIPVMSTVLTVLAGYRIGGPELAGIACTLLALIANYAAGKRRNRKALKQAGASGV